MHSGYLEGNLGRCRAKVVSIGGLDLCVDECGDEYEAVGVKLCGW